MAYTTEQLNTWFGPQMNANSANVYYETYPSTKEGDQQPITAHVPKTDLTQLPEGLVFNQFLGGLPMFLR